MYESNISIGVLRMIDGLEISEVINRIKHSSLSFNSRQLIYSRLINEVWHYNFHELKYNLGMDNAFDSVYINFSDIENDDDETNIGY